MFSFIPKSSLVSGERLGSGSYGEIFKASWYRPNAPQPMKVTLKVLYQAEDVWREVEDLVKFDHPNILKFLGISQPPPGDEVPWIVLEGSGEEESLLDFVDGNPMSLETMVRLAYQVAVGMRYLHHTLNPLVVHADLSAKSVLVFPGGPLKLAKIANCDEKEDTEYCDHYYDPCYCREDAVCDCSCPYPLRWMPPENIPMEVGEKPKFNKKGDVWSYGVVLFEIWTRGKFPFSRLWDYETFYALKWGYTPRDYDDVSANPTVVGLMNDCWEQDPDERTNFLRITQTFQQNYGQVLAGLPN